MRAGYLRNKVYYLDFTTVSDGMGGTIADYYTSPDRVVSAYALSCSLVGGVTIETSDCGSDVIAEFCITPYFWASVNQKDGSRGLDGAILDLDNYTEIRTRFTGEINKKWLLAFEDRNFTIHSYRIVS